MNEVCDIWKLINLFLDKNSLLEIIQGIKLSFLNNKRFIKKNPFINFDEFFLLFVAFRIFV